VTHAKPDDDDSDLAALEVDYSEVKAKEMTDGNTWRNHGYRS
jgi:hypothetical protein